MKKNATLKKRSRTGKVQSTFYADGVGVGPKTAKIEFSSNLEALKEMTVSKKIIAMAWIKAQEEQWNQYVKDFKKAIQ